MRARLTKIAKDAADRLSGKSTIAGDELLSLERQMEDAIASRNVDKLRFLLFQVQKMNTESVSQNNKLICVLFRRSAAVPIHRWFGVPGQACRVYARHASAVTATILTIIVHLPPPSSGA
jgi:hypothetical protein